MKRILACALLFTCLPVFAAGNNTYAQGQQPDSSSREFIMACSYGVMAGTLVGFASLAFTSKPSDNLNRVARGASIGLYAGIALGLYVVYVVPGMEEENADEAAGVARNFMVSPLFASSGGGGGLKLDGARADATILRF